MSQHLDAPPSGQGEHPVVMLVGSTGGVDAVIQVLQPLPADLDASLVVLQHQDPASSDRLAAILERRTALRVSTATEGAPLAPGHVLVAPSGMHTLVTHQQTLALIPSGERPPYRPSADLLLVTAATSLGRRAVAVVLSGYGVDGATGATAIAQFGGIVIASDEASSTVFSMPRATIGRGNALDRAMPLEEIPAFLVDLSLARDLGN